MPSGAGRTVTRRDRTAASIRATTAAASSSAATRRAARSAPLTPRRPRSGPTRRSTSARCSLESTAVTWARAIVCRSPHTPAVSASIVTGISCTRARARPTKRSPRVGDSRRARATSDPTDRATSCGATTSRERRTASVALACAAAAAPLTRSRSATRSMRSRSVRSSTSTEASHPRKTATGAATPDAPSGAAPRHPVSVVADSPPSDASTHRPPAMKESYRCPPTHAWRHPQHPRMRSQASLTPRPVTGGRSLHGKVIQRSVSRHT